MISYSLERDERMGWSTHMVRADGRTICGITDSTPQAAVDRFVDLCKANDPLLAELTLAAEERREWNMAQLASGGQGRDWPAFRKLEQMRNKLLREAGIKDT